ncbi:MAG: hypothetical protein ABIQ18_15785, partial [Umezawaea sp.]
MTRLPHLFAIAGVLLAVIARVSRSPWPRGRQLAHDTVVGLLMQGVQFGGFYSAIGLGLPGGVVALMQGLNRSYGLSRSESCCQGSCSAGRPERCWVSWLPAFTPRPGPADRVRGPVLWGRVSSRPRSPGAA